jgi:hypothetical protein
MRRQTGCERETPLHSYELARLIDAERQCEIERRLQIRAWRSPRPPSPSIRQSLGRGLIHIGSVIEGDGGMRAGRRGPSRQQEIRL